MDKKRLFLILILFCAVALVVLTSGQPGLDTASGDDPEPLGGASPGDSIEHSACSSSLCIEEHTEYGIVENTVYLTITDIQSKPDTLNITMLFKDDPKTRALSYKDIELYDSYSVPVYGSVNTSSGKCDKVNAVIDPVNQTETRECIKGGSPVACTWIAGDTTPPNITACTNLDAANTCYRLTASIYGNANTCMNVTASNITLDCLGVNSINLDNTTAGIAGVNATGVTNFTLANCTIGNVTTLGVLLNNANSSTVYNTNITGNFPALTTAYGVKANNSDALTVQDCEIGLYGGDYPIIGISLTDGTGEDYGGYLITGNTIELYSNTSGSLVGIDLRGGGAAMDGCELSENYIDLGTVGGDVIDIFVLNPDTGTIDGLVIRLNEVYADSGGGWAFGIKFGVENWLSGEVLGLAPITNSEVSENELSIAGGDEARGILFNSHSSITDSEFTGNLIDVYSDSMVYGEAFGGDDGTLTTAVFSGNTISGETITAHGAGGACYGIQFHLVNTSNSNDITDNDVDIIVDDAEAYGIYLLGDMSTDDNDLSGNFLTVESGTTNAYGLYVDNDGNMTGLYIDDAVIGATGTAGFGIFINDDYQNLTGVTIHDGLVGATGIAIKISGADYGTIRNTTALGGDRGMWMLEAATGNVIDDSNLTGTSEIGVLFSGACENNTFYNSTFSGGTNSVWFSSSNGVMLNSTYANEKVESSQLDRGWYADFNITDAATDTERAGQVVAVYNSTNASVLTFVTTPGIDTQELVEYVNTSTALYATPYLVLAYNSSFYAKQVALGAWGNNATNISLGTAVSFGYSNSSSWFFANVTLNFTAHTCFLSENGTNRTMTKHSETWFSYNATPASGNNTFLVLCNSSLNGSQWFTSGNATFIAKNDPPTVTGINWRTLGGFTDRSLLFSQYLVFINATCADSDGTVASCEITLTDPFGTDVLDAEAMSTDTPDVYTYAVDYYLAPAGNWTINVTATDDVGATATAMDWFDVSITQLSLMGGYYGYRPGSLPSNATLEALGAWEYNLLELTDDAENMEANWSKTLAAFDKLAELGMKGGVEYVMGWDFSEGLASDELNRFIGNISALYVTPEAVNRFYLIPYIKLNITEGAYSEENLTTAINTVAYTISAVTGNAIAVYSTYNSSLLLTDYVRYYGEESREGRLHYVSSDTSAGLINKLANLTRSSTRRTRIFQDLADPQKAVAQLYYENIMREWTGLPNITTAITDELVSELVTQDIIVYNNLSTTVNVSYDISGGVGIVGSDIWDYTNGILLANNTDGVVMFRDIAPYEAILVGDRYIDHISLDNTSSGTAYEATADAVYNSNYTDGTREGASDASTIRATELWDGGYISNNAMIYYGWLNSTGGCSDQADCVMNPYLFDGLHYLVIADQNDAEVDKLFDPAKAAIDYVFGYVSVSDYDDTDPDWLTDKYAEVDAWLALNGSMNIFLDGLDYGVFTDPVQFAVDIVYLSQYVTIDKGAELAVNVFTNFESFAMLSSDNGFAMRESCTHKWAYCDPTNTTYCYSDQYWEDYAGYGDYNQSKWYNYHDVNVVCVAFIERNNESAYARPSSADYAEMENLYLKAKVLGYEYVLFSQPLFNVAYFDKHLDVGTKLQREPTVDGDIYSTRYTKGIAYYNSSSNQSWFDDGLEFNNGSVKLNLLDNAVMTYDVGINGYSYPITTAGDGWSYDWHTVYFNETVFDDAHGHYNVTVYSGDGGFVGDDQTLATLQSNGKHSFYDNAGTWASAADASGNHMLALITNTSRKGAIDTTGHISQSEATVNYVTTITVSSVYDYNTSVWTYQTTSSTSAINSLQYYNVSAWVTLTYNDDVTCTSVNPNFFLNVMGASLPIIGACVDTSTVPPTARFSVSFLQDAALLRIDSDNVGPDLGWNWTYINSTYTPYSATGGTLDLFDICVNASEAMNCSISFNGIVWANATSATDICFYNLTVSEANYTSINVTCEDAIGNHNTTTNAWLNVDSTAPSVTNTFPMAVGANHAFNTTNTTINFQANVTETGSWVENCSLWLENTTHICVNTSCDLQGDHDATVWNVSCMYTFPGDDYREVNWSIRCDDNATNELGGKNQGQSTIRGNLTIYPQNGSLSDYNFTLPGGGYAGIAFTITWSATFTDIVSSVTANITAPAACSWSSGANYSAAFVNGTISGSQVYICPDAVDYTFTFDLGFTNTSGAYSYSESETVNLAVPLAGGGGGGGGSATIGYYLTPSMLVPIMDAGNYTYKFDLVNQKSQFNGQVVFEGEGVSCATTEEFSEYLYPPAQTVRDIPISCDSIGDGKVCVRVVGSIKKECAQLGMPEEAAPLEEAQPGFLEKNWPFILIGFAVAVVLFIGLGNRKSQDRQPKK